MPEITHQCDDDCRDGCWYENTPEQVRDQARLDALEANNALDLEDVTGFDIEIAGTIYSIDRDVCTEHPAEVHQALGTDSESELQHCLDQMKYSDWFDGNGRYVGRDENGLGLR